MVPVGTGCGTVVLVGTVVPDQGLKRKGCTTFRPNLVTGEVLHAVESAECGVHCCTVEREAD